MTDRQQAFIEAYVGPASLNATKAALLAGYEPNRAMQEGHELKKQFRAEIDRRLAERGMSAGEVLERFAQIARNDAAEYIEEDGYVNLARMRADGKIHLVKGVKETQFGKQIELFDPQSALGTLAKHHGLLRDQVEITTLGRLSKELDELSDAELLALAERIAGAGTSGAVSPGEAAAAGPGAA